LNGEIKRRRSIMWRCRFFHKWGRWSERIVATVTHVWFGKVTDSETVYIQKRVCLRCGKEEIREVC
jgi:hypothetical protein